MKKLGVLLCYNDGDFLSNSIESLIKNKKLRLKYQKQSYKKFYLTNKFIAKKIDFYRDKIIKF